MANKIISGRPSMAAIGDLSSTPHLSELIWHDPGPAAAAADAGAIDDALIFAVLLML